jgi:hypothetical protein
MDLKVFGLRTQSGCTAFIYISSKKYEDSTFTMEMFTCLYELHMLFMWESYENKQLLLKGVC